MEILGHGGIMRFGNSEGKGGLKCGSRPWYGTDIFWNRPSVLDAHYSHSTVGNIFFSFFAKQFVVLVQH